MWIDTIATRALEDDEWYALSERELHIAVIKLDGAHFAIENCCTHAQVTFTDGWIEGARKFALDTRRASTFGPEKPYHRQRP
jgi:nitrite reductase/ring-hydroxylating ferredoxin subunit